MVQICLIRAETWPWSLGSILSFREYLSKVDSLPSAPWAGSIEVTSPRVDFFFVLPCPEPACVSGGLLERSLLSTAPVRDPVSASIFGDGWSFLGRGLAGVHQW